MADPRKKVTRKRATMKQVREAEYRIIVAARFVVENACLLGVMGLTRLGALLKDYDELQR